MRNGKTLEFKNLKKDVESQKERSRNVSFQSDEIRGEEGKNPFLFGRLKDTLTERMK